jgi:hypothetical protein
MPCTERLEVGFLMPPFVLEFEVDVSGFFRKNPKIPTSRHKTKGRLKFQLPIRPVALLRSPLSLSAIGYALYPYCACFFAIRPIVTRLGRPPQTGILPGTAFGSSFPKTEFRRLKPISRRFSSKSPRFDLDNFPNWRGLSYTEVRSRDFFIDIRL